MIVAYASRTGTRRNLEALRNAGWRLLVSAAGSHRSEGFRYCLDNGAWSSFQSGTAFDAERFQKLLDRMGDSADWIAIPDVVGNRSQSLKLSEEWLPKLSRYRRLLLCLQDGMTEDDVSPWLNASCGIFLGGSTEWKLSTMRKWGDVSFKRGCHYHVARVNSARRIYMARESGAHSIDGSSASRYSDTLDALDAAVKRPMLWTDRVGGFQ